MKVTAEYGSVLGVSFPTCAPLIYATNPGVPHVIPTDILTPLTGNIGVPPAARFPAVSFLPVRMVDAVAPRLKIKLFPPPSLDAVVRHVVAPS